METTLPLAVKVKCNDAIITIDDVIGDTYSCWTDLLVLFNNEIVQ